MQTAPIDRPATNSSAPRAQPRADARPGLVVVCQELTPYRIHLHRRLANEIPELALYTLVTWDPVRTGWRLAGEADIHPVHFGVGEVARRTRPLGAARNEIHKARLLWRWLDEHRPAAMLNIGYYELSLFAPMVWAHRNRVPFFLWGDSNIHGDSAAGLKRAVKRTGLGWVLRRASAVLACGRYGREFFLKYGADPTRIILSPCEPDYGPLQSPDRAAVAEATNEFGLRPGRRRALVCGRLNPVKRPDLAVDAFVAVADARPDWDLVFAGDGPLRRDIEARVPTRLRNRVVFTGFISNQRVVTALYHACDLLLHPADYEPWALVINEAVASGLAVVTTSVVGAAAELVRDGVNGRIVPPNDLPALVAALGDVTEPDRLRSMRAAAPGVVAEWQRLADPVQGIRAALARAGVAPVRGASST